MRRAVLPLLCVVSLLACSDTGNLCPAGFEPLKPEARCVPVLDASVPAPEADRDAALDAPVDGPRADAPRSDPDASTDADHDRDAKGPQTPTKDASEEAETAAPFCSAQATATWKAFHETPGLNNVFGGCVQSCDTEEECLLDCAIESSGLTECQSCAELEGQCLLELCWIACSPYDVDAACRACLCEAGCTDSFEQCAGRSMDTCEGVYGRDFEAEETALTQPLVLRYRSGNGYHVVEGLDLEEPGLNARRQTHWSIHWTHLLTFPHEGRTYLLQHKSECGNDPCLTRISPLLRDGSVGPPVYQEAWSRGWDELAIIPIDGVLHLLRYKSGASPTDGPRTGSVRIDALQWQDETLTLRPALEQSWSPATGEAWSSVETFVLDGQSFVLRYGHSRDGEVQLLRLTREGDAVKTTAMDASPEWTQGWDVIRTFPFDNAWYVLRYTSGALASPDQPAGSVRIAPLQLRDGQATIGPDLYEDQWDPGLSNLVPFRTATATYLWAHWMARPDEYRLTRLSSVEAWSSALGEVRLEGGWGGSIPWDVVTVAPQHRWQDP